MPLGRLPLKRSEFVRRGGAASGAGAGGAASGAASGGARPDLPRSSTFGGPRAPLRRSLPRSDPRPGPGPGRPRPLPGAALGLGGPGRPRPLPGAALGVPRPPDPAVAEALSSDDDDDDEGLDGPAGADGAAEDLDEEVDEDRGAREPAGVAAGLPRGVTQRRSGKWQVQLYYAGKSRYIGMFDRKADAAAAYDLAQERRARCRVDDPSPSEEQAQRNVESIREAAYSSLGVDAEGVIDSKGTTVTLSGDEGQFSLGSDAEDVGEDKGDGANSCEEDDVDGLSVGGESGGEESVESCGEEESVGGDDADLGSEGSDVDGDDFNSKGNGIHHDESDGDSNSEDDEESCVAVEVDSDDAGMEHQEKNMDRCSLESEPGETSEAEAKYDSDSEELSRSDASTDDGDATHASFHRTRNRRRSRMASSSTKPLSKFNQWMGRKKTAPIPAEPGEMMNTEARRKNSQSHLKHEKWQRHVEALKAFKQKYGHTNVPYSYPGLGSFVRNARALNNMPDESKKGWALTDDRRRELEELDFQWVPDNGRTHAYRKRSRNITRAASTINALNNYCISATEGQFEGQFATNDIDPNRRSNVAKQLAIHIINREKRSNPDGDDDSHAADRSIFHLGLMAGVTEIDLFHAFENVGKKVRQSDGAGYPHLSLHPTQEGKDFNEWLLDRKLKWRNQHRKRKRGSDCDAPNHDEVTPDLVPASGPKLQQNRLHIEQEFDTWLVERKSEWRQMRLKREAKPIVVDEKSSLCSPELSIEEIQQWISVRKVYWKEERKRKIRKAQLSEVCNNPDFQETRKKIRKTHQTSEVRNSQPDKHPAQSVNVDYRSVGVRQTSSGKWAVEISYKGKLRYIGTFITQDEAALANQVARENLKTEESLVLTPEEDNAKVKLARVATMSAISKLKGSGADSPSSVEGMAQSPSPEKLDTPKPASWISVIKEEEDADVPSQNGKKEGRSSPSYDESGNNLLPSLKEKEQMMKEQGTRRKLKSEVKEKDVMDPGAAGNEINVHPLETVTEASKLTRDTFPIGQSQSKHTAPGLRKRANGKWEVAKYYHGKRRYIATFSCRQQAARASEMVREKLNTSETPNATDEEIKQHILSARKAALLAVSALKAENCPQTKRPELNTPEENSPKEKHLKVSGLKAHDLVPKSNANATTVVQPKRKASSTLPIDYKTSSSQNKICTQSSEDENTPSSSSSSTREKEITNSVKGNCPSNLCERNGEKSSLTSYEELNVYLKEWVSRPKSTLMPSLEKKEQIMKDTGASKARIEGWFYRARKRNKQHSAAKELKPTEADVARAI